MRSWVRSRPHTALAGDHAREIAEEHRVLDLLTKPDALAWEQVGNLLLAMNQPGNDRYEITGYADALAVYDRWTALADRQEPSVDRAALLASTAHDLSTGPAALVAGASREVFLARIRDVLGSWELTPAGPVEARRAEWVIKQQLDVPQDRFAVRVVVPDPNPAGFPRVQTRIVVDGRPVVPAAFASGPPDDPARLLDNGLLRATEEPREVRLAEADCTEGCCGALYVTIVREGDEVVWRDWRTPDEPPEEFRFDAGEYDAEIERATGLRDWEWPARTASRLLNSEFEAEPDLWLRWDCRPGGCAAWLKEYGTVRVTFFHPARTSPAGDPWVQFGLVLDVGERDPAAVVAEFLDQLLRTDPKSHADMIGGTANGAEQLGLVPRPPSRWR